jgi:hypothetical protein
VSNLLLGRRQRHLSRGKQSGASSYFFVWSPKKVTSRATVYRPNNDCDRYSVTSESEVEDMRRRAECNSAPVASFATKLRLP